MKHQYIQGLRHGYTGHKSVGCSSQLQFVPTRGTFNGIRLVLLKMELNFEHFGLAKYVIISYQLHHLCVELVKCYTTDSK